jgi:hypothetical protein
MTIDSRDSETLDVFVKIYVDLLNSAQIKFDTFNAKRLSSKPTRWTVSLYLLGSVATIFLFVLLESMGINGISALYVASVTGVLGLIVGTYVLIRKEKVSRLKIYRKNRDRALFYEPERLWGNVHPQSGERGRLIMALLGARHIARTIEESTTVPLSSEVIDTVTSYLIQGISAAKEDDIHEHYIKETLHLCQEIHDYYSRYYPVIEVQQLLRYGEDKS